MEYNSIRADAGVTAGARSYGLATIHCAGGPRHSSLATSPCARYFPASCQELPIGIRNAIGRDKGRGIHIHASYFVKADGTHDPAHRCLTWPRPRDGIRIFEVTTDEFVRVMVTNSLSPMRVVETLQDLVSSTGLIGIMSSGQGSVANNATGMREVYRGSKAALNQFMRSFAARHSDTSRAMVLMAPGWVRTEMGGPDAHLSIEESVPNLVRVLLKRNKELPDSNTSTILAALYRGNARSRARSRSRQTPMRHARPRMLDSRLRGDEPDSPSSTTDAFIRRMQLLPNAADRAADAVALAQNSS